MVPTPLEGDGWDLPGEASDSKLASLILQTRTSGSLKKPQKFSLPEVFLHPKCHKEK